MAAQDVLRDYVLFNVADKLVGRVESFKPPTLQVTEEDFRAAGMDVPLAIDLGMEKLESEMVLAGIDRGFLSTFGLENGMRTSVRVRGAVVDSATGIVKPVHHFLTGNVRMVEQGEWKAGQRATLTVKMSLIHYKLTHGLPLPPVIEIDVFNSVRLINGIDQMLQVRLATGR